MAANAVLVGVVWFAGAALLAYGDVPEELPLLADLRFAIAGGVFVAPFAILGAFVVGTLCWRYVVPDAPAPSTGAVGGAVTATGSLLVGAACTALLFTALVVLDGGLDGPLDVIVLPTFLFVVTAVFAATFVGWLAVPVAAFGGWYHERARRRERLDAGRVRSVE